ncbi:potassium-transporting ATPase subunit C [Zavarzinella formosa]|uniref:potassium-transporting ATPase subunit C n=1 Tax=Zavarzinella formosa TaxID=360055 RepID=UPI0003176B8A|nr:potassium-transporting ATPase subunit C [Zavarzinella formosa]
MKNHLRGNLFLLLFTVGICCVLYPLTLYVIGRGLFPTATSGGLVNEKGEDTKESARGSRLIAQPFTNDEYFWPRPSAASYNATASGGSNLGSNNPKLRDRVAQQLGPMLMYKKGSRSAGNASEPRTPQQDIEEWFAAVPDRAASWASDMSVGPANWAKADLANDKYGLQGEYILQWAKDHPEIIQEWKNANADKTDDPKPEDMVSQFFASFAKVHPKKWPGVVEVKLPDGKTEKKIEPVSSDSAIHANFFDLWLSDPANKDKAADLETVPVDMVTTSGSGLDPDITRRNALSVYQLDRVARKRAASPAEFEKVKKGIADLVVAKSFTPLSGLIGEPLVNVLELNIELDQKFPLPAPAP